MKTREILLTVFLAVGVAGLVSSTYGQNPKTGNSPSTTNIFEGKLSKVDAEKKTIAVTGTDEKGKLTEMSFKYNDATEVVGGDRTVQGLTGNHSDSVKVTFRNENGDSTATATRIEVVEKRATP
jgi:hypothetical protein